MLSTPLDAAAASFCPLHLSDVEAVLRIEQTAYAHPWTRANFVDTLNSGYQAQMLVHEASIIGYYVAMHGVDEVHLLNITVAPAHQGQGWSVRIMQAMHDWARDLSAQWSWLEVRLSNVRAIGLYQRLGYSQVGRRNNYYPAGQSRREDALVMSLQL